MESKNIISSIEFDSVVPVKHKADLIVNDVLYLCEWHLADERVFEKVVCTGYCGKDEFWGETIEGAKPVSWCDNDIFKIVGRRISVNEQN